MSENIPELTKLGIDNYKNHKLPPGSFVKSILENNLFHAIRFADKENRDALADIIIYVDNNLSPEIYGNREKVFNYLNS